MGRKFGLGKSEICKAAAVLAGIGHGEARRCGYTWVYIVGSRYIGSRI